MSETKMVKLLGLVEHECEKQIVKTAFRGTYREEVL